MNTLVTRDEHGAARRVATIILEAVASRPDIVLGLATGRTMLPVYRILKTDSDRYGVSFARVTVFMLDEYVGLGADDPRSFAAYARTHIGEPLGIGPDSLNVPNGTSERPEEAADAYEAAIGAAGGVDLQLLGLGSNGHIGFNEPPAELNSRTHVTQLTASTRADNARDFGQPDLVPPTSITMGVGTIMDARQIVVLAVGSAKARAVQAAISGPVTELVPASALQLHQDVTFIVDSAAAPAGNAHQIDLEEASA